MHQTTWLTQEWQVLQREFDSYEKYALIIKLVAIVLFFAWSSLAAQSWLGILGLFLLWGQEAIWKTYQSRIETRLLAVERALASASNPEHESSANGFSNEEMVKAFQFNSAFTVQRGGVASLIKEYASQALRPTVAFPHVFLCGGGILVLL